MRNDFCTGYLAHSAKGKTWGSHKYVAKVKLANGKYFYFYNLQQYQNYLKRRGDVQRQQINDKKTSELAGNDTTLKKSAATADNKSTTSTTKNGPKTTEEKKKEALERIAGNKGSSSSKKSGKSSSSSSKDKSKSSKSSSGSGKSSSSKSKGSTDSSGKEKSSSGSSSSKKSSGEKENTSSKAETAKTETATEQTKSTPSLSAYKYQYDLKDDDINTYTGAETDRVSNNRVAEIIDDMIDKYPDNASGYLLSSFSDSINYEFKWVKEGGTIKLIDPDTGDEVPADTSLTNSKYISLFRTDDKKKKS